MPVACSMPSWQHRWSCFTFGILGASNTRVFRPPLDPWPRSMRLFLGEVLLIACDESLPNASTRVAVRMTTQAARRTEHERCTRRVALFRLPPSVANDRGMAARTLPAGNHALIPRLILRIEEDTPLHPESPFAIATAAVLTFLWLQFPQVLKHQDGSALLLCEMYNAAGYQVSKGLITIPDLLPESGVILLAFCYETSALAIARNASQPLLPNAGYRATTPTEAGSEDRTFSSLNGAHGNRTIEIQIDGAHLRLRIGELLCELKRCRKPLLHRSMQPPATSMPYQRRTARLGSRWQFPACETYLEPGPTCTGPYFDDHATLRAVLPHTRVE